MNVSEIPFESMTDESLDAIVAEVRKEKERRLDKELVEMLNKIEAEGCLPFFWGEEIEPNVISVEHIKEDD